MQNVATLISKFKNRPHSYGLPEVNFFGPFGREMEDAEMKFVCYKLVRN